MGILHYIMKSLVRRKGEIIRVVVATFVAVFFVTGVLTFESNMYYWQMASNKERFGDWFVMEAGGDQANVGLAEHPYLNAPVTAANICNLMDEDFEVTGYKLGYLSEGLRNQGHITLLDGRMPEADNEMAGDMATLLKMGYSINVGDTIQVRFLDKNNQNEETTKEYILVGILRSYSNIWASGSILPGILVSEQGMKNLNMKMNTIYAYSIKNYVKTSNYRGIYEDNLKEAAIGKLYYNDDVYDYEPWGSKRIYNYMYLLVVVIGVATIAYQLIGYHNSRKKSLQLMNYLGVSKGQTAMITALENVVMLVPAGLLGVGTAFAAGKGICSFIERKMGIQFYQVEISAVLKGLLSIVIALALWELVTLVVWLKETRGVTGHEKKKEKKVQKFATPKKNIDQGNLTFRMHARMMKSSGISMNIGIRVFFASVCFVSVVCVLFSVNAYSEYKRNNDRPDLIGYQVDRDADFRYQFTFFSNFVTYLDYDRLKSEKFYMDEMQDLKDDFDQNYSKYAVNVSYDELNQTFENKESRLTGAGGEILSNNYSLNMWSMFQSKYATDGNNNIYEGISDETVNDLKSVPGVEQISFGSVESERVLTWDNMNYELMGRKKLQEGKKSAGSTLAYKDRYLFETNYITPSKAVYEVISKYMDKEYVDYNAWASGEQILVIVNDNPSGEYDDTLKPGAIVNYHYTQLPTYRGQRVKFQNTYPYTDAFIKLGMGSIVDQEAYKDAKENPNNATVPTSFSIGHRVQTTAGVTTILDRTEQDKFLDDMTYRELFAPCVAPVAAGVVYLDDSVKDALKDIVVDYGYYTVIASDELAKQACDSQNEFMAEALKMDVSALPDNVKCTYSPNQIQVRYTLASAVSSTSNIVEAYCKNIGINYASNTEDKVIYRSQTINAFLQYGITLLAVCVVAILISAILAKSRYERRREKYILMLRLGADKGMIVRMCMLEALREGVWCILLLPFLLLIQWGMYVGMTRKL